MTYTLYCLGFDRRLKTALFPPPWVRVCLHRQCIYDLGRLHPHLHEARVLHTTRNNVYGCCMALIRWINQRFSLFSSCLKYIGSAVTGSIKAKLLLQRCQAATRRCHLDYSYLADDFPVCYPCTIYISNDIDKKDAEYLPAEIIAS